MILETAVGSQKSAQALGAPGKIKKFLITTKVTTPFFISPCAPISCTSFLRPTAASRMMVASGIGRVVFHAIIEDGNVEKSRQRRSRHFVVLTY